MNKEDPALTTEIDEKLLKCDFVRVKMKPTAKAKGTLEGPALTAWRKPLLDEHYTNEDFADEIHVRFPTDLSLPIQEIHGHRGAVSPSWASFVYLDVGAWVGSKDQTWGKTDGGSGRFIKRDFGIVCGPLVLLCTYDYAFPGAHCSMWEESWTQRGEPWESVSKLVAQLSKASGHDDKDLGKVVVRDAFLADSANPRWPEDPKTWVIHVILGDMHIPVLDKEVQTYGGAGEGPRVPRFGRLDVGATEWLINDFAEVKPGGDGAKGLDKLVDLGERMGSLEMQARDASSVARYARWVGPSPVGHAVFGVAKLAEEAWRKGDWSGIDDGTMKREDAKKWYEYYRHRADGQKPADIFENAWDHFRHFIARLAAYAKKHQEGAGTLPAKFVQLGDMLDFWVGFTCHYWAAPTQDQPLLAVDEQGTAAIKHWTDNLFGATEQGKIVAAAIDQANHAELHPVYLWGNHDNYLGTGLTVTYPFKDNPKTPLARRQASYERLGLFMEHGHQWEGSNADNAGTFIPPWWTGTWSPIGMTVTQASFIQPEPIRLFEGKAAGAMARVKKTFGQRLDQIIGAGYRFLASSGGFYCYVMGHTHSACLTRVVVATRAAGGSSFADFHKQRENDPKTRVYLTHDGEEFEYQKFVPAAGKAPHTADVNVEWAHMLGDPDKEWIALEEVNAPATGSFSIALKGFAAPNEGGPSGVVTFKGVPAGAYYASYYLTRYAEKPFKTSLDHGRDQKILIEGMSIRGDQEHKEGTRFVLYADGTAFYRPIFLRWVFDRHGFFGKEAWFGLYRAGEPDDRVSIIDPNAPEVIRRLMAGSGPRRPAHRFFDVGSQNHPWWGTFDFTLYHPGAWDDRMEGEWQFRAFNDFARKKPLGMVSFEIKQEDPRGHLTGHR